MIFGLIFLALVVAVAAYHYVQGAFSAMISAVLAILAAMLALSFHEAAAESLFSGQFPNQAHAVALVALFAIVYAMLRIVVDKLLPGNVRLPVLADKIAAGVFGAIAGVFAAGILAIAAQMLPLGATIAGYERFATKDREVNDVQVPGKAQRQNLMIYGELQPDTLNPAKSSSLFPIPVDSVTLGLTGYVSDGGSLAGDRSLASVHPSYLDELFGQRFVTGSKVLAPGSDTVSASAYILPQDKLTNAIDFESKEIRKDREPALPPMDGMTPLVLRTQLGSSSTSFTMSAVDLILGGTFYNPIGSLQRGSQLLKTRPDDPLLTDGKPVDLVFIVPAEALHMEGPQKKLPAGAYLQVKRTGRADLAGKAIADSIPSDSGNIGIKEKERKQ